MGEEVIQGIFYIDGKPISEFMISKVFIHGHRIENPTSKDFPIEFPR